MRVAVVLGFCLGLGMTSAALAQTDQSRVRRLHNDLHLTADQEAEWRDYTAAIMPDAQATARLNATEKLLPQLTTPRRIALIDAAGAQQEADLHRRGAVVITFYESLSAEQQRTFDRETIANGVAQSGG